MDTQQDVSVSTKGLEFTKQTFVKMYMETYTFQM